MATPGQAAASAGDTPSNAAEIEASFKLIAVCSRLALQIESAILRKIWLGS